jgi:hypothetical protein
MQSSGGGDLDLPVADRLELEPLAADVEAITPSAVPKKTLRAWPREAVGRDRGRA